MADNNPKTEFKPHAYPIRKPQPGMEQWIHDFLKSYRDSHPVTSPHKLINFSDQSTAEKVLLGSEAAVYAYYIPYSVYGLTSFAGPFLFVPLTLAAASPFLANIAEIEHLNLWLVSQFSTDSNPDGHS